MKSGDVMINGIIFLGIGGLLAFVLSWITWMVILFYIKMTPAHWPMPTQKILVVICTVTGMLTALIVAGKILLFFYWVGFVLRFIGRYSNPCYPHMQIPDWAVAAECQKALDQKNESIKPSLETWLRTPPWLRESCDSIDPFLCTMIEMNPMMDAWPQYIILILMTLASALACASTGNRLYVEIFRTETNQMNKTPDVSAN